MASNPRNLNKHQKKCATISRRTFVKGALLGLCSASFAAESSKKIAPEKIFCVPAGAKSVDEFTSKCLACGRCVSACKGSVLRISTTQWGILKFMVPFMDFDFGYCKDDCNSCSLACPSGAILPISLAEKSQIKIGRAQIDLKKCLIFSEGKFCDICIKECTQKAIEFRPRGNSKAVKYPKVRNGLCTGCGKCAYLCHATPKAISILPFKIHL